MNFEKYISGGLGLGLFISECLGMTGHVSANGIVHGCYLFFKTLDTKPVIDSSAVVHSLEEVLIHDFNETDKE